MSLPSAYDMQYLHISIVMFVVTGLHTKRRPSTAIIKSNQGIKNPPIAKAKLLQDPHRRLHLGKHMSSSSSRIALHSPQPGMARVSHDKSACNQDESSRRLPIKLPLGRPPTRVRRFIPKPLILVERMKSRQLLLELSPFTLEAYVSPESVRQTVALVPPILAHETPTPNQKPPPVLSSISHSSSSVSFWMPSQSSGVFGRGFGQMRPRLRKRLSVATLDGSSASTDTFVADSPCFSKRTSKFAARATKVTTTNIHVNVDPREKYSPWVGVSDLAALNLVRNISYSGDAFEPGITSTPFGSSQADVSRTLSLTQLVPTVYPGLGWEQTFSADTSLVIASPTSLPIYHFNGHKGAYVVKLPSSGPPVVAPYPMPTQHDVPLMQLADQPKPALDFKRPLSRVASPPPTLVLDGVFALPLAPTPSLSPIRHKASSTMLRPHKPSLHRPLTNGSKAIPVVDHPLQPVTVDVPLSSATVTTCGGQLGHSSESHHELGSGPESPRSKLAHVLTAHVHTPTTPARKPGRIQPPLVTDTPMPHCPRVDGLRICKKAGLACGDISDRSSKDIDSEGDKEVRIPSGRGALERVTCAGIGMVARLRARWERGAVEL